MRCARCDAALWKVRSRECPSCGAGFKPSEFRFRPGTVRFCCQHCGQGYLGSGAGGLPEPRRFECVYCGRWIDADEMVLELAEGVAEHETAPDTLPWVEGHRSWPARWGLTAWLGVRDPARLMELTPEDLGARPAVVYGLVTLCGGAAVLAGLAWLVGVMLSLPGGSSAFGVLTVRGLAWVAGVVVLTGLFACAWVAVVMVAARRGGRSVSWDRVLQAVCLTCLPQVLWLVPGLGPWIGWMGTLAWARSVSRALAGVLGREEKKTRLASWGWPVGCAAVWVVVWFGGLFGLLPSVGGQRAVWFADSRASVGRFLGPIRDLVAQGRQPVHAAELLADGTLPTTAFCAAGSRTTTASIELVGTTLEQLDQLAPARRLAVIQQAAAQRDPAAPAHRMGDFVFIFDALDGGDPALWLVVEALDPVSNPGDGEIHLLHADGSVRTVLPGDVAAELLEQNWLRAGLGHRGLGDPRQLRGSGGSG